MHNILGKGYRDIHEDYLFDADILGQGAFGLVRSVTNRSSGLVYACKTMLKSRIQRRTDVEDMQREVWVKYWHVVCLTTCPYLS
jgi:calcium-dependent protein kinase